jgi:hypothetical protein
VSLFPRTPRPLSRDKDSFRDDRLFIIACDDTYAPKQYFGFFKIPRIQVHVVPTQDGTSAASHVLSRLVEIDHEDDDERWMILDVDHYAQSNHIASFVDTLKEAGRKDIKIALSKPSFEVWLLLHHADGATVANLANSSEVEIGLRNVLGEYNKTRLKKDHYPNSGVAKAYASAVKLDHGTKGLLIPESNTSRVYLVWKAILDKALPSQLPAELRDLKNLT